MGVHIAESKDTKEVATYASGPEPLKEEAPNVTPLRRY